MSFFEVDNLRAVTRGRWLQRAAEPRPVAGVGIDTRSDLRGRAYVALRGGNHDGHDFLAGAAAAGAAALIVEREVDTTTLPPDLAVLLVEDARASLAALASAYRRRLAGTRVIAVTGSCGKTTTKQMIHGVLEPAMRGTVAVKSFNNDIGVPLTILAARPTDKYLLLEIGTNAPGEIAMLSRLAEPDVAVITHVGRAHLGGLGSVADVAAEKAAILRHLRPSGVGIVNIDAPEIHDHLRSIDQAVVTFGVADDADLRLVAREPTSDGQRFEVNPGTMFTLPLPGRHNAINALAAIAVGRRMGLDDETIASGLAAVEAPPMRLARHEVAGVTVFDDAYNANPDSVIAALETFIEIAPADRRRVIVLGDMLELGDETEALHREVGRHVVDVATRGRLDHAVFVGPHSTATARAVEQVWSERHVAHFTELTLEAADAVAAMVEPGDVVLLKGSRGMALERVTDAIERQFAPGAGAAGG